MKYIFTSLLVALVLGGCSASPKTSYYRLTSEPVPSMPDASNTMRLMVGPVTIPSAMDRPQLVTNSGGDEVQIHEYQRWAGSLKGDAGRVIASNLARNLGTSNVWNFSQSTQAQFDYQVFIDVQSFESAPGQDVVLDVLWTIGPSVLKSKNASSLNTNAAADAKQSLRVTTGRSLVREPVTGTGFDALVAAQSRAFNKVGGDISKKFLSVEYHPTSP